MNNLNETTLRTTRLYDPNSHENTLAGVLDVLGYLAENDLLMKQNNTPSKSLYYDGRAAILDIVKAVIEAIVASTKQTLVRNLDSNDDEEMTAFLQQSTFIAQQMINLEQLITSKDGPIRHDLHDQSIKLINANFGYYLKQLRHDCNLTRTQAANELDVEYGLLKNVELGHAYFNVGKLIIYCSIVGKDFMDVMAQFYASHTEPKIHQRMAQPTDSENE